MNRYGTLIAGAVALFAAAWDTLGSDTAGEPREQTFAVISMTLGLLLIGAWLAVEMYYLWKQGEGNRDYHDDHKGDENG
jgi:hypothetical protein